MLATVAADFYWLGRYAERAEHTARLLRHQFTRLPDTPAVDLARGWRAIYRSLGQAGPAAPGGADEAETFLLADAYTLGGNLMEESGNPGSVLACWGAARENGRSVRPHLPLRVWTSLNQGFLWLRDADFAKAWADAPAALATEAIDRLRFFAGVVEATMPRDDAWRFLELGRFVERLQRQTALLDTWRAAGSSADDAPQLAWADLLRLCGAYEFFCRTHSMAVHGDAALAFLVRNPALPRSLRFALQRIDALLDGIDPVGGRHPLAEPHRAALRIGAGMEAATGRGRKTEWGPVLASLAEQSLALHDLVLATYVHYSAAARATP